MPTTVPIAKAIQLRKVGPSAWIQQTFGQLHNFSWQQGDGAFTVSVSQLQKPFEHHRTRTFQQEYLVHQVSDWCSGVAVKMAAGKAVRAGLAVEGAYLDRYVTEEQRQPPAHFHRNPAGCAAFDRLLCRSSAKDHRGYSPSSLRASSQNSQQRHYTSH